MQLAIQRGGASSALRKAGHLAGLKITAVLGWPRFLAMGVWVSAAPPGGWGERGRGASRTGHLGYKRPRSRLQRCGFSRLLVL